MPLLSIVIPIYNTPEAALLRCLDSVNAFEDISFEALLIDDGSQANVGDFCKAYAEQHPAFRYLYKENGGVSSARNYGLDHACGQYVMFVDADDMLLCDAITAGSLAGNEDLILFDMYLHQKGSERIWHSLSCPEGPVNQEQLLYHLLTGKSLNSPCVKLFRRSIIEENRLRFNPAFISGEDWMFVCDFTLCAHSARYLRTACYRYYLEAYSGQSRIAKHPDTILQNQFDRFARKLEVAETTVWQAYQKEQILRLAATELIENLFNSASELMLAKQYTPSRKASLRDAVLRAGALLCPPVPKKTRLKKWVVTRCPIVLRPMAWLRALYLKLK